MLVAALTLGFGAIGSNLIFMSLVCIEIAVALEEFNAGIGDYQVKIQSINEILSSINSQKDLERGSVEGDALSMRRRRILEQITAKPFENVVTTTQPSFACNCSNSLRSANYQDVGPFHGKEATSDQKDNMAEDIPSFVQRFPTLYKKYHWGTTGENKMHRFSTRIHDDFQNCECDIPIGSLVPTSGNPKGAVRRYPMKKITIPLRDGTVKETPAPSQIAIESAGSAVMLAPRRILYNFNQNGRVNITHIRELSKYTTVVVPLTEYPIERTTIPTPRYQYKYIRESTGESKSTFYPTSLSKLFIRRLRKMLGEKSHVTDKAYAIERDILQSAQEMILIDRQAEARKHTTGKYSTPEDQYNPWNEKIERISDIWRHSPFRRRNNQKQLVPL